MGLTGEDYCFSEEMPFHGIIKCGSKDRLRRCHTSMASDGLTVQTRPEPNPVFQELVAVRLAIDRHSDSSLHIADSGQTMQIFRLSMHCSDPVRCKTEKIELR